MCRGAVLVWPLALAAGAGRWRWPLALAAAARLARPYRSRRHGRHGFVAHQGSAGPHLMQ